MAGDPHFNRVSLLLPMTGSNGGVTFTDYSPTPKTVSVFGNTNTSTAQSKWGGSSGYFDETGDYLTVPKSSAFNFGADPFTIEVYAYLSSYGTNVSSLIGFGKQTASDYYSLRITVTPTGFLAYNYSTNGTTDTSRATTSTFPLTTWKHVALCREGNTLTIYSDGVAVESVTVTGSIYYSSADPVSIGTCADFGGFTYANKWHGYLQDLRITKGAARYTADFTPPSGPFPTYQEPRALELYAVNRPIVQAFNPTIFNG